MNKTVFAFLGGAAAGSLGTYIFMKKHDEKKWSAIVSEKVNEATDSYRAELKKLAEKARNKLPIEEVLPKEPEKETKEQEEYERIVSENEYESQETVEKITEDDFYESDGYDSVQLTLYSDGLLADDEDSLFKIGETIGEEMKNDILADKPKNPRFYRNNFNGCKYEVAYDNRTYSTVTGIMIKEYDD